MFRRRDPDGHGPLTMSLTGRLGRLVRPGWARSDVARRVAAGLLVIAATVLWIRDGAADTGEPVVVASRDLSPGRVLTADDLRTADHDAAAVPDGTVGAIDAALGHTLSSPVRAGEILTDVRLLGPRLAQAAVGSADARVVPVRLSDAGLAGLIREGDRVDVLTTGSSSSTTDSAPPAATMLASGAAVVLVAPEPDGPGRADRVVMLALPTPEAGAVAAASLTHAITVTLH
ncbi:Flp pilus assembly protein CpaB [Rhodococcus sp. ABRD24]|nr:Flp pilus assembly protein CpaB [Rhodococcus sp. ABRD24]